VGHPQDDAVPRADDMLDFDSVETSDGFAREQSRHAIGLSTRRVVTSGRSRWQDRGFEGGVHDMTLAVTFLFLLLLAAVLWLVPRIIFRSSAKIPTRVPQEWIDDYHSGWL